MFFIFSMFPCSPYSPNLLHVPSSGSPDITIDIFQSSSSPQSSKGGNREQTLPTKSNPNPDLTDAGEAENRWDRDFHGDDGHHDDESDEDDYDVECEDGLIETCEKVPHVNVSISCRESEEEQDNHKQGDFPPISGEFRFQKLVAITVIMLTGILYLL